MTDREKLMLILGKVQDYGEKVKRIDGSCVFFDRNDNSTIVDHLIANGVTVQKWIPVTERLPENICPVLAVLEGISTVFNGWYHDGKWWTVGAGTRPFTQKVTHWMPLPEPPREGE